MRSPLSNLCWAALKGELLLETMESFGLKGPLRSQKPQGSLACSSQPPQEMLPVTRRIRDIQYQLGGSGMPRTSLAGGCCWEELCLWLGWMFQGAASVPSQSTGIMRLSFLTEDFLLGVLTPLPSKM